ncbi:ISAon1 family transposase [Flavobacterium columnare]|uniref:ISAon1 family transposase n=1 Tax=Flavobacterium columnare TaxID=996 RepID=UPI001AF4AFAC|nr:transposase [Flavobacterium columnare]QOH25619.1 transposase [Flavobacterium columnare]QOH25632.1 transposase [Flavobacterium columnare]QOH25642.1 transposase [Flavobacterium columnare]QOH25649.1 transposase [Flavobacterium columnare]QOH25668.1 transposase [Flavobacterium columnare]
MRRHYKKRISGFTSWKQLEHAENYLIYPENIGENLSIDEVSLSKGELYTFVTNKQGRGKKKSLVAVIKGTKSQDIIDVVTKIPLSHRKQVKSITLDMANNMQSASRMCFPESYLVTDRFHVVKLVMEALQHLRIKYRWEEIEKENQAIKKAKEQAIKYIPITFENQDTPKQLLARCRYIIAKKPNQWTETQKVRAQILFQHYPLIHQAYKHTQEFRNIYEYTSKEEAKQKILNWISKTKELKMTVFNTVANSLNYHLETIANFFVKRHTNANAESFNSKIKLFRANQRGVVDTKFFLFRMEKLFA